MYGLRVSKLSCARIATTGSLSSLSCLPATTWKIYVSAQSTVIMETGGRRKSVVSSIALSRFGGIACVCRGLQSLSVVVGTASRVVVRRRSVLFAAANTLSWLFFLPWSRSIDDHLCLVRGVPTHEFSATLASRLHVCTRTCTRVCARNRSRDQQERKVRGQVLRYTEVHRGLSRVSRSWLSGPRPVLCSNARFSSHCGEWSDESLEFCDCLDFETLACYCELTHVCVGWFCAVDWRHNDEVWSWQM